VDLQTRDWELSDKDSFLQGFWIDTGSAVVKDAGWMRIDWLTETRLERLARHEGSAAELYRNPGDGSFWERLSAAPELPDGGPPMLVRIDAEEARRRFNIEES